MSGYYYLDIQLRLRDPEHVVFTPAYFRGSIESSLESFFGEIGGKTTIDIVHFSFKHRRAIFRVPEDFYERTRIAVTLIGHYQEEPCHFQLLKSSKEPIGFENEEELKEKKN